MTTYPLDIQQLIDMDLALQGQVPNQSSWMNNPISYAPQYQPVQFPNMYDQMGGLPQRTRQSSQQGSSNPLGGLAGSLAKSPVGDQLAINFGFKAPPAGLGTVDPATGLASGISKTNWWQVPGTMTRVGGDYLRGALQSGMQGAGNAAQAAGTAIGNGIGNAAGSAAGSLGSGLSSLGSGLMGLGGAAASGLGSLGSAAAGGLASLGSSLASLGPALLALL